MGFFKTIGSVAKGLFRKPSKTVNELVKDGGGVAGAASNVIKAGKVAKTVVVAAGAIATAGAAAPALSAGGGVFKAGSSLSTLVRGGSKILKAKATTDKMSLFGSIGNFLTDTAVGKSLTSVVQKGVTQNLIPKIGQGLFTQAGIQTGAAPTKSQANNAVGLQGIPAMQNYIPSVVNRAGTLISPSAFTAEGGGYSIKKTSGSTDTSMLALWIGGGLALLFVLSKIFK